MEELNKIGYDIIGVAYEVRKHCGKDLLECFYEAALAHELRERGYKVEQQVLLPVFYKGVEIKDAYRMDLVVEDKIVIELKSIPYVSFQEVKQLNTYMFLSNIKLGYLINFSARDFSATGWKDRTDAYKGIIRIVN